MPGGKNVIVSGRFYMGNSINGLALARFSVNVTVNVAAPQHAACQRQPIYELLSPVAYPLRSITPCFTPLVPLLRPRPYTETERGVILIG